MAASLDQIIKVSISQATAAVAQPSFSTALIVGPTDPGWTDSVHVYTSPDELLTDGYDNADPEYIYAQSLYGQTFTPTQFMVGKRLSPVAQIDTLAVTTVSSGHAYSLKLNGITYTYTASGGDTQQAILTALEGFLVASGLVSGNVTGTGGSALLTLTAVNQGQALTYSSIDANLAHVNTIQSVGIAGDLATISAQNDEWYCLLIAAPGDQDILQAAPYIQANEKICLASTSTSAVATGSTTDVGSVLHSAAYDRTGVMYKALDANLGPMAAWAGGQLPQVPGSNNWAWKSLAGIQSDKLTSAQQIACRGVPTAGTKGKCVNIYTSLSGFGVTQVGTMASGQFIDVVIGNDWVKQNIQARLYQSLISSPKIPYTDRGSSILISAVRSVLDEGVINGFIADLDTDAVTAPSVLSVSALQRANRIAPTISFHYRLAGAYNAIVVQGTVTI